MAGSQAFLRDLKMNGCAVFVPNCDVISKENLSKVLSEAEIRAGPIEGVIQAAILV